MKQHKHEEIAKLEVAINSYIDGEITAAELKHSTAPFGIYQQRNGDFMIRIRITGGHLDLKFLQTINEITDLFSLNFIHLTIRQAIQLHDVKVDHIIKIVHYSINNGLVFRGGGGNTYRNIFVSPDSGISEDTVFDVHPYAAQIQEFVFGYHDAYDLPRKLKISFSSSDKDTGMATVQDLGFIAKVNVAGERGFQVFAGGGMGRISKVGIEIFEFLPETEILKAVAAMIDFFHAHGNRENRNKARIRFMREALGDEAFVKLYMTHFDETEHDYLKRPNLKPDSIFLQHIDRVVFDRDEYSNWLKRATETTIIDSKAVAVTLFVPNGVLTTEEFTRLAVFLLHHKVSSVRLTPQQNILIPAVKINALSELYSFLEEFPVDLEGNSFAGQLQACIGSTTCKIGILDTPTYAIECGEQLDAYFEANPDAPKDKLFQTIIKNVKFSGCPNCCGQHAIAQVGFEGMIRKDDEGVRKDVFKLYSGGELCPVNGSKLAMTENEFIDAYKVSKTIIEKIITKENSNENCN